MSIVPLPQFEKDLEEDRKAYERLAPPSSIVVRFGAMRLVGEFPYRGEQKPGCGSKIVVRTFRGIEMGEMLTSTCPNAGCSKSVTRKEMLEYIENSGGKDYPFYNEGKVLRVATVDDMNEQRRIDALRPEIKRFVRTQAEEMGLAIKIVEVEPILGGERLTVFFLSEERVDFRDLVGVLAKEYSTRIDMRQVGARDEARLTADYERCGQHCCCKQFLKVLKPVSMRSAKMQKASLDPLKISGRCGRLMCCLRYEDQSYMELKKRLPHMKSRHGSPHGIGIVIDRQILTQLVLLRLEHDDSTVAVPIEELCDPEDVEKAMKKRPDPFRGADADAADGRRAARDTGARQRGHRRKGEGERTESGEESSEEGAPKKRRRRRGRRRGGGGGGGGGESREGASERSGGGGGRPRSEPRGEDNRDAGGESGSGEGGSKKRRRRRRRRGRGRGGGGGGESGGGGGGGSGGGGGPTSSG